MSVYRSSRRPPHIVFLVDTLPFVQSISVEEGSFTSIQALVVRILLYYVYSVDERITWGFRFFNSKSSSITMSNRRFHPVSTAAIHEFVSELRAKVDRDRLKAATKEKESLQSSAAQNLDSCFSNLKQTLMQTLAEYQWKDIDLLGASPRSQRIRNSTKAHHHHRRDQPVMLNNYIYVISHRPHTVSDLRSYIEGHHSKAIQTKLTPQNDALDNMKRMADELKRWLWDDYAHYQISINWIDRETDAADNKEIDQFIQKGFNAIMEMFGGHLIEESMLQYDYERFGLSFNTVFDHYRNQYMDGLPEFKLTHHQKAKRSANPLGGNDSSALWSGLLRLTSLPHEDCQVNVAHIDRDKPRSTTSAKSNYDTTFDKLVSLETISVLHINELRVEWSLQSQETVYILWSPDKAFSKIINCLQRYHMVILVNLCFSDKSITRWAILEPVFQGCASLSLIQNDRDMISQISSYLNDPVQPLDLQTLIPLGSNLIDGLKLTDGSRKHYLPQEDDVENKVNVDMYMDIPPCVRALTKERSRSSTNIKDDHHTDDTSIAIQRKAEEPNITVANKIIPTTIDEFTQAIQDLYLDTLYTSKFTLLESISTLLSYIDLVLAPGKENCIEISSVLASLQSITMLSSEFDDKHRSKIPAMVTSHIDDNHGEQEQIYLSKWLEKIRTQIHGNADQEELFFKALKIRDAKLQVIFLLTTIQVIRQQKGEQPQTTPSKKKKQRSRSKSTVELEIESHEEQLETYFDRMFIWEQVSNVVGFLQERDLEASEKSKKRLDQADIYIHHFFGHLDKCFSTKLPDVIRTLSGKVDKDDSNGDDSVADDGGDDLDSSIPIANKRRKTLLEMRMRGDTAGETITADWVTMNNKNNSTSSLQEESQNRQQLQQRTVSPSSGASKRKETMFPILPFMKREIIMSKVANTKSKQTSVDSSNSAKPNMEKSISGGRPLFQRSGSFTKSASSSKRAVKRKPTTETNTVVLRKREHTSPTTPRTRLAREFGISLTPQMMITESSSSSTNDNDNTLRSPTSMSSRTSPSYSAILESKSPTSLGRNVGNRELGIAVSPVKSAARKVIGHKSPRSQRVGSARELFQHDHGFGGKVGVNAPRDLTTALLAARDPSNDDDHRASPTVRKAFSHIFDE